MPDRTNSPASAPNPAPDAPKRRGRPTGTTIPPERRKSVMLRVMVTAAQAAKFDLLGAQAWLRERIDKTRLP